METRWRADQDDWSTEGEKINAPDKLARIRETINERGPLIVERWHYRGSASPDRLMFDDYDDFESWLRQTVAGDMFMLWDFAAVCRDDNGLVSGKAPDSNGEVPRGGAY